MNICLDIGFVQHSLAVPEILGYYNSRSLFQIRISTTPRPIIYITYHCTVSLMSRFKRKDRNLILLVLAVVLVVILWGPLMWLAKLAIFVIAVYVVYQLLRENL